MLVGVGVQWNVGKLMLMMLVDDARWSRAGGWKVGQLMLMMLAVLGPVVEGGGADTDDARWSRFRGGRWGS